MSHRLLVLDDEPILLDTYKEIFAPKKNETVVLSSRAIQKNVIEEKKDDFEVTFVNNGLKALEVIERAVKEKNPIKGGFFDVKLGEGIDGIETIRRAKDLDPNLLCVIVTAYQDRNIDEINKIFGESFSDRWDFMSKPFSQAEIIQKARNLISNSDRRKREKEYVEQIKQHQQNLIQVERLAAVGGMARTIAHEFGNILFRIIAKAELALQVNTDAERSEALQMLSTASERANMILRNLQSMVSENVEREHINPCVPLKESITLISTETKKFNIRVHEDIQDNIPDLHINKAELGQVFLNILINAMHSIEEAKKNSGDILVKVFNQNNGVSFQVVDTGCGIRPENLAKVFQPLFTTKVGRGNGLGLSVSRKIVEHHGGTLSVQSQVGKGTVFTVWLPKTEIKVAA